MRHIFLMLGLLFPLLLLAQSDKPLSYFLEKYPEAEQVVIEKSEKVDIRLDGDSVRVVSTLFEEIIYLRESGLDNIGESVYSSSFNIIKDLKAYTRVPNRKKFEQLEVEEFFTNSDIDQGIFFDDSQNTIFSYPGVVLGARTVLDYTRETMDPHFFGSFFFGSYRPIERASFEVTVDDGINLIFNEYNFENLDLVKSKQEAKGRTTYLFELTNIDKYLVRNINPSFSYIAPNIRARIGSYTDSKGQVNKVLEDVDDLYSWYQTFIADKKYKRDPELAKLVSEITRDAISEIDKVKAVFYWVQDNIKYIAFEDGMRGFVPHDGTYVCEKRYGDCKDMASIIVNMLFQADVDAHYTWIGTRDIPYTYDDLPSPAVDNHMIASYIDDDDNVYYLDATGQYMAFGQPTSMIQGKQALIAIDKENYRIETVPVIPAIKNLMDDVSSIELIDGGIVGEGVATIHGFAKVNNSFRMLNTDEQKTDDYVLRLMGKGSNKFFMDDYSIEYLEDRDTPISLKYEFRIEDYYKEVNGDLYVNLNLDKGLSGLTVEDEVKYAKKNKYQYIDRDINKLIIPEGYSVKKMPKNVSFSNDVYAFDILYEVKGDHILLTRTFELKYLLMQPDEFDSWNEGIRAFGKEMRRVLVLSKIDKN